MLGKRDDVFQVGGHSEQSWLQYIKNKLKSEIFNDKKVYKQKYFSVITKNLNLEVLTIRI